MHEISSIKLIGNLTKNEYIFVMQDRKEEEVQCGPIDQYIIESMKVTDLNVDIQNL